jgi:hypothetical protein
VGAALAALAYKTRYALEIMNAMQTFLFLPVIPAKSRSKDDPVQTGNITTSCIGIPYSY